MVRQLTVYKASAGSGKTFSLATEYIRLLVRNPQSYRQILAVTFTNKATEEMKMRILSQLYGIWKGLPASEPYARKVREGLNGQLDAMLVRERAGEALHLLLHNYSYFRVETIDSFFQSVMRNLARELNLTANLRVELNDVQVEELAVDQLVDSLTTTDQMLQWLMRFIMDNINDDRSWNVMGQLKRFGRNIFRDFYKDNSQQLALLTDDQHFFDRYQHQLRDIRRLALEHMQALGQAFFDELEGEGFTVDDLKYGRSGVAGLFVKLQNGVFDESALTKRALDAAGQPEQWYKKDHPHREALHVLVEARLDPLLRQAIDEQPRQWRLYKSADLTLRHLSELRLLGSIERKVRELNEEQNRFLLSDTQQLLHDVIDGSDSPFIFEKIGAQLEHIMIDEFQDTSTVQWQNFKILLYETMSHRHAGNLIVGDVKQSIYRWRGGDWNLLADIARQFPDADEQLHIETLSTNYRSCRRVVSFNNAFFQQAATVEAVSAYDDVVQQVPEGRGDDGQVTVTLLPAADYEQSTLDALTTHVSQLLGDGYAPADIAILVRANNYIPLIARHFAAVMPQVKVVSDEAFRLDASPAVVAIVQALRALAHPEDDIARAYLVKLAPQAADAMLADDAAARLLLMPLYDLTIHLYALLRLNELEAQSAYLCAFYDQVNAFVSNAGGSDVDAFLRQWDDDICSKTIQSPATDGLRLISIHKSKGLEFPCVLIPFCDWRLELPDVLWCEPAEAPFNQLPLAAIDFSQKGMTGTIYEHDYAAEHTQNMVDNLNLLYVAFTRAQRQLFVIGRRHAGATSRSALIEQVLPEVATLLDGAVLSGEADEAEPLAMTYGTPTPPTTHHSPLTTRHSEGDKRGSNPFLQPSTPIDVPIEVLSPKVSFRQSNKSQAFVTPADDDDDEALRQEQYIQLGSVLHSVLSSIRTTDDVERVLHTLEQEGVVYNELLSRPRLLDMLRKRLSQERVAEWFTPGRWQLFNECTILTYDAATQRTVERRPDRVMTDGHETIVVDFKFGRERDDHRQQVRQYMDLLSRMGHASVRGYLWYVYSNKIVEV